MKLPEKVRDLDQALARPPHRKRKMGITEHENHESRGLGISISYEKPTPVNFYFVRDPNRGL